ncbi:unnamed protein product [Sphagnum balticum]
MEVITPPLLTNQRRIVNPRPQKAALQSEAGQGSKREGLTQGKLDSSMSGPARKSRIAEKHWSYSRRQQASCESKLRRPVQCWQHLHENFLPELLGVLKIVNLEPSRFMRSILRSCGGGKQGVGVVHDHIP